MNLSYIKKIEFLRTIDSHELENNSINQSKSNMYGFFAKMSLTRKCVCGPAEKLPYNVGRNNFIVFHGGRYSL